MSEGGVGTDLTVASEFMASLFGHDLLGGLHVGTSKFPPQKGVHAWHAGPTAAANWLVTHNAGANVYYRVTPVRIPPASGRGSALDAAAIVEFPADIDIDGPAHRKKRLPPDIESARRVVERVGLAPTFIVHSGHGLQPHWVLNEPWVFPEGDFARAQSLAKRFGRTIAAAAEGLGWTVDNVSDLARILRAPGTLNRKLDPLLVRLLDERGPRYSLDDIESVLVDEGGGDDEGEGPSDDCDCVPSADSHAPVGFTGSDDELLAAARRARNGERFAALFDRGNLSSYDNDDSRADWHLVNMLAFWTGPVPERIDRLFRCSKLMRPKWGEVHSGDGRTYGRMTIDDVLAKRTKYFMPRPKMPIVIVTARQLRDQTADALAALELVNKTPQVFQRGRDIVRVRRDETTGNSLIQAIGVDEMVGLLTRSADYLKINTKGEEIPTTPPQTIARDILALPAWTFPPLIGVVESPRVRPDGTVLLKPGYDPATKLWLADYAGSASFSVPDDPTDDDVADSIGLINELLCDFPCVSVADRANAVGFMLTPVLRPAIAGSVPLAAFDAKSKQGTGKGLLVRVAMIVVTGREPSMCAIPGDEPEWRKALTAALMTGAEVLVFDNATSAFIESGVWANVLTADVFNDRILGVSKRVELPVRCTWGITGNGLAFGGDMVRRTYQVMQDAGVERPEDRTGFKHALPAWAFEKRLLLLRAGLILSRRWWSDGCPVPRLPAWGNYEEFERVVGGVLAHAGINGFMANRTTFRDAADVDRAEWFGFVAALAAEFGVGGTFTASAITDRAKASPSIVEALPVPLREAWDREKGFKARLGKALRGKAGAVFAEYRLSDAGRDTHAKRPLFRVDAHTVAGGAVRCGGSPNAVPSENEALFWDTGGRERDTPRHPPHPPHT